MPTILITGANRGIGLEFARQYAANGWDVIGTARDIDQAADLSRTDARVLTLDVGDQKSRERFISKLGETPIDLFINNAGVSGPMKGFDQAGYEEAFNINAIAPVAMAEALKPNIMRSQMRKIMALSSELGSIAQNESGGMVVYRATKAALNAAYTSLAIDYKADGITIGLLHPGWVQTDMGGASAPIDVETSVTGMRKVIDAITLEDSGVFIDYQGNKLPW